MRWCGRPLSRELRPPGGQVYYVYNRVKDIAELAARIQRLVPDATVAFAHGQMREHELERIMYALYQRGDRRAGLHHHH